MKDINMKAGWSVIHNSCIGRWQPKGTKKR